MFKLLSLICVSLLIGCSNNAKKSTEAPAPATNQSAAVAEPKVETKTTAKTQKEKKSTANAKGELTCLFNKDERKLSVNEKGEGCELSYSKEGKASVVATQIKGQEKCDEVFTRIQTKLEASGFKCE